MDSAFHEPSTAELLHDLLATDQEIGDVLNELAYVAASEVMTTLPVLAGITLQRDKRIIIVGSSDDEARKMDEVQAGFKEGPCLEAQATGTLIRVHDVRNESRWPDYMAAVCSRGAAQRAGGAPGPGPAREGGNELLHDCPWRFRPRGDCERAAIRSFGVTSTARGRAYRPLRRRG